jgi:iron complex outermembrane receptor protein
MKVLVLIFFSALCVGAQATGTLTGKVSWTRAGVERAKIVIVSKDSPAVRFEQITDTSGNFRFDNVPAGEYEIVATGDCFNTVALCEPPFARSHVELVPGGNNTIELTLTESVPMVSESVRIAAADLQMESEIAKTVNVITGQEMRDRADFTLIDTVRTIPGFRVQQLGGFGRTASIKSRGLRNQDTAILIDGVRFRDPGSITGDATPFLSDFTLTSVSRIEVLRGSGSSLYGTNAVGGTIDFQTPTPARGVHGQISGAAGGLGLGRFRGNLSYGTPNDKFGISGAVSRTAYTKGIDGHDNASNTNVQSRIEFNPFSKTNLSGRFFVSNSRVRLNTSPDTFGPPPPAGALIDADEGVNFTADVDDPDSIQQGRFFSGQFFVNHVVNGKFLVTGFYQGLTSKRTNTDGPLGVGFQSAFTSSFGGAIHTANVRAVWTPVSSSTLTGGYEFEVEDFENTGDTPGADDDFRTTAGQRSHTLYVQELISFFEGRLQLSGGARAQWFTLGRPQFSVTSGPYANLMLDDPPAAYTFDGSASYFISKTKTKLRTHVGNGYRVPSLYERFGTFFFLGTFFPQGNPGLRPERSIGIDAGIEQYLANDRVKLIGTYFYTRIRDEITYLPTDDFGAPAYYNFDRHYSRGVELSTDLRPTRSTNVFASYTFTNSDVRNFRRPSIATLAATDGKSFGIPDHQFTLVATQRIKRFWISADFLATSSYLAPIFSSATFNQHAYRFTGNRRLDLTAGYTFPIRKDGISLRLFGTIENVFDHEYFENGFRTVGRNGRVGLSFGF